MTSTPEPAPIPSNSPQAEAAGPVRAHGPLRIDRLWVNGASVPASGAELRCDSSGRSWQVSADLAALSPFQQRFGLSMQLDDGRVVHGTARLVQADRDRPTVVFEGLDVLGGAWAAG